MTSTLSPSDTGDIRLGEGTRDLTYLTQRPALRRADVSGEFPFYQPKTFGDVDELARAALDATLVHAFPLPPLDSLPEAVRRPAPSMHRAVPSKVPPPFADDPEMAGTRKAFLGRGTHRRASRDWAFGAAMFGWGMAFCACLLLAGAHILAAFR